MVIQTVSHLRANVAASDQRLEEKTNPGRRTNIPGVTIKASLPGGSNISAKTAKTVVTLRREKSGGGA